MSTILAFAMYRPAPGKKEELQEILKDHIPTLRELGFITDGTAYSLESKDGTLIEVFEWVGEEAKTEAHHHPAIRTIWAKMMDICTFPGMNTLPEAEKGFPGFEVVGRN